MGQLLLSLALQAAIASMVINLLVYIVHLTAPIRLFWRVLLFAVCNFLFSFNQIKFYPKWVLDDFVFTSCVVWVSTCSLMLIVHAVVQLLLKDTEQAAKAQIGAERSGSNNNINK